MVSRELNEICDEYGRFDSELKLYFAYETFQEMAEASGRSAGTPRRGAPRRPSSSCTPPWPGGGPAGGSASSRTEASWERVQSIASRSSTMHDGSSIRIRISAASDR